jgi:hypothetical protein
VHSTDDRPWYYLEQYLKAGHKYIGISPTGAIYQNPKLMTAWLKQAFDLRPPDVKYHGFGVTGFQVLKMFPFWSVDSSSWTSAFRFANIALFDDRRGVFVKANMRSPWEMLSMAPLLATYGLRPGDLHADRYDRFVLVAALIESCQREEQWLRKRYAAVPGVRPMNKYMVTRAGRAVPNGLEVMGAAEATRRIP